MSNYDLAPDEVILFESPIIGENLGGSSKIILTSKKTMFEKNKTIKMGLFKSKTETIITNTFMLDDIKKYNGKAQVKQTNSDIYIQTTQYNITIKFYGIIEARKFATKITDAITGTTIVERGTEKIKETFNKVDDVLGFNTRDTIKGVIENGIASSLLKRFKSKKK